MTLKGGLQERKRRFLVGKIRGQGYSVSKTFNSLWEKMFPKVKEEEHATTQPHVRNDVFGWYDSASLAMKMIRSH